MYKVYCDTGCCNEVMADDNSQSVMAWLRERRFKKLVHVDVDCRRAQTDAGETGP